MLVVLSDKAKRDILKMDEKPARIFAKHIDKISKLPPRRHLKHGLPYSVDEVGGGRLVYTYKEGTLYIIRCFTNHRDYEKWYESYE
ncbi:MAG TPA: hypothetical protein VGJ92_11455 [Methanocella sp.]|jgi:mRNA-degrading endonuclease RelE of RelBE toxin-antitoxin system